MVNENGENDVFIGVFKIGKLFIKANFLFKVLKFVLGILWPQKHYS